MHYEGGRGNPYVSQQMPGNPTTSRSRCHEPLGLRFGGADRDSAGANCWEKLRIELGSISEGSLRAHICSCDRRPVLNQALNGFAFLGVGRPSGKCTRLAVPKPHSLGWLGFEADVVSSGSRSASGLKAISSSTSGRRISICARRSKTSLSAAVSGGWVIDRGQSR